MHVCSISRALDDQAHVNICWEFHLFLLYILLNLVRHVLKNVSFCLVSFQFCIELGQELVEFIAVVGPAVEMETEVFVEARNGCELVGKLLQLKVQRNFNLEQHLA